MSLKQSLEKRIDHAKERQQFWKEVKDIAKIWAGIESELTMVSKDLDEATKQIREIDLWKWLTTNFPLYNLDNLKDFQVMLESFRRQEVLAVLGGADNK